jgi:ATP-dependent DNA helicase RecQ
MLRQGTAFYAAYAVKLALPLSDLTAQLEGERAGFVRRLFAQARKGRILYTFDPDAAAAALAAPRDEVVAELQRLQEEGRAEVRASEVRHRYRRLRLREDPGSLLAELVQRFQSRERQAVGRVRQMLDLVTHAGCQANALVRHFGEIRQEPCGQCTHCMTGAPQALPTPRNPPPLPAGLDPPTLRSLRSAHPAALGTARQLARFLCGLTSPALTRSRLTRHTLFGALEDHRFQQVLSWCETI